MEFFIPPEFPSELTDWEILSAHMYLRLMKEGKTPIGKREYDIILQEKFANDKDSLDAWLYRLTKQFEYEFNKRHEN